MSGCCAHEAVEQRQRRLLWVVLTLNAIMFVVEFIAGWLAHSSSLLADSLDMLADAVVYGISLYAVGRAIPLKARAALANGWLQFTLSLVVLGDVARRLQIDSTPEPAVMNVVSLVALAVNVTCFGMLYSSRGSGGQGAADDKLQQSRLRQELKVADQFLQEQACSRSSFIYIFYRYQSFRETPSQFDPASAKVLESPPTDS